MSFSFVFIELTKSFDLVSRDGLFKVLAKIGCQHKLVSMTEFFHTGINGTVQFYAVWKRVMSTLHDEITVRLIPHNIYSVCYIKLFNPF